MQSEKELNTNDSSLINELKKEVISDTDDSFKEKQEAEASREMKNFIDKFEEEK